jgi:transcriptional regulator with XRE-family HTH domain
MEERLTFIMKAKNLSMTKFADEIDVQRSNMSHVMNGRNKASLDFIRRILKRFPDINPDWLLFGKGSMTREDNGNQSFGKEEQELLTACKTENNTLKEELSRLKQTIEEHQRDNSPAEAISQLRDEDPAYYGKAKAVESIVTFYRDSTFKVYYPL